MMENQALLTSPDGPSDKIPAESCTGSLYSQDCSQEHHKVPQDYQKDNLIGAKAEGKERMWDDEPCEENEPIGTGSPREAKTEEEDEGNKEEQILSASGGTRGTPRNVNTEKEEEGHISMKEANIPTEIGADPRHRRLTQNDVTAKEEEGGIREGEIPMEIGAGGKGSDRTSQLKNKKDRSKMDVYVDPGELVDLIRARPELWDICSDGYNNSLLKNQSWEAVTSHFFQDFPQRSSETRSKMLKEMKKKWKSLRDRFKKDLKFQRKSRSEPTPTKYKYHPLFHKMSFLISSLENRLAFGNVENEEEEQDDNEGQSQEQRRIGHAEAGPSKDRERAEEGSDATFPPEKSEVSTVLMPSPSPNKPTKKGRTGQAKTDPQKDVIKMTGRVSESSERVVRPKDGISYFLQSLEGDIRKVAPARLTKLKMDLMKVVYEAQQSEREREQGHLAPSSSQYPSNFYPRQSCSYCHHFHSPQPSAYPYAPPPTHSPGYMYASSQPHISSYHQASVPTQSRSPAMPDQLSSTGHATEEMPGSSLQNTSRSSVPILEDI